MISKKRGRPKGPKPLFAHTCTLIDAAALLSRCRGLALQTDAPCWTANLQMSWLASQQSVPVRIVSTA
jgi:hypothetical protein